MLTLYRRFWLCGAHIRRSSIGEFALLGAEGDVLAYERRHHARAIDRGAQSWRDGRIACACRIGRRIAGRSCPRSTKRRSDRRWRPRCCERTRA